MPRKPLCYNYLMKTHAFIDASNLFYGGEKSLGWKVDYKKLLKYLKEKYNVSSVYYFGGVEIHSFKYDYLKCDSVSLVELKKFQENYIKINGKQLDDAHLILLSRHLQRIKFYLKLQEFGYKLFLKPVKLYYQTDGGSERKANCDVEMAFYLMRGPRTAREIRQFAGGNFRDFVRLENDIKFVEKE